MHGRVEFNLLEELMRVSGPVANVQIVGGDVELFRTSRVEIVKLGARDFIFQYPTLPESDINFDYHGPIISDQETIKCQGNSFILISRKDGFNCWIPEKNKMSLLYEEYNIDRFIDVSFVHEIHNTPRVPGSGRLVFFMTSQHGDFGMTDLKFYIIDRNNRTRVSWYLLRNFCFCEKVRFQLMGTELLDGQEGENIKIVLMYRYDGYNGTHRVATRMTIVPLDLQDRSSPNKTVNGTQYYYCSDTTTPQNNVLKGFRVQPSLILHSESFQDKLIDPIGYGLLKPTSEISLMYHFFEGSSQFGLMYIDRNDYNYMYFTYSETCVLPASHDVVCFSDIQNMLIRCLVHCDGARIEGFTVRISVEDLSTGASDDGKVEGLQITNRITYWIPDGYSVIKFAKGVQFDVVVVDKDGQGYLFFFSEKTGQIFTVLEGSSICSPSPSCLKTTLIYDLTTLYLIIVPQNSFLGADIYVHRPLKLSVPTDLWEISHEDISKTFLRVNGINNKYVDIALETLMEVDDPGASRYTMGLSLLLLVLFLLACCLLVYFNRKMVVERYSRNFNFKSDKKGKDKENMMVTEQLDLVDQYASIEQS